MHAGKGISGPLPSLGLAGDGDEIAAVTTVETMFGVTLDYGSARDWHTAGDVYAALLVQLDHEPVGAWRLFARAIASETGVDPEQITSDTRLLGSGIPPSVALRAGGTWLHGLIRKPGT